MKFIDEPDIRSDLANPKIDATQIRIYRTYRILSYVALVTAIASAILYGPDGIARDPCQGKYCLAGFFTLILVTGGSLLAGLILNILSYFCIASPRSDEQKVEMLFFVAALAFCIYKILHT